MKASGGILTFLLFSTTILSQSWASPCPEGTPRTTIIFVNGVDNDPDKVQKSLSKLEQKITSHISSTSIQKECLSFVPANNSNETYFLDYFEAARQVLSEFSTNFWRFWANLDSAPDWFQQTTMNSSMSVNLNEYVIDSDLRKNIEQFQNILKDSNIVVVAHSQGNLYANLIFDALTADEKRRTRLIAVATPASSVADGGPHVTLFEDAIASFIFPPTRLRSNEQNQLPPCGFGSNFSCHNFVESYLDGINSGHRILGHIVDAINAITIPNNPPTLTSFTANPMFVQTGGQSTIAIVASDPDTADIPLLTYDWSATCGVLSGLTGPGDKTWTAPSTSGICTVSVIVTDPAGANAMQSVDIEVTPAPSATFVVGDRVQVDTGDGSNLNVRSTPGGVIAGQQAAGSWGTVIGGPIFADGRWWWHVDFDTGADGWVAEEFLGSGPPPPSVSFAFTTLSVFNRTDPSAETGIVVGTTTSVFNRAAPDTITRDRVQVDTGDGSNLNVRSTPGGAVVGQQPEGSQGTVISGPVLAGGFAWWEVNFDTGTDGWVAEDFLEFQPSPPQYAYTTVSAFNTAAPDAIAGHVEGLVFSVDNLP